jgi:hypothetical protein
MKLKLLTLPALLFSIPSTHAVNYTLTAKAGWGEGIIDQPYLNNPGRFSDEGTVFSFGAGLAFDTNIVTGVELSNFKSASFFGSDDRMDFSEYKLYLGYRFNLAEHFRITPMAGLSNWKLQLKEGAFDEANSFDTGTYRDKDAFAQINIEFPINELVTIVSSIHYTDYDFGVIRSTQAGIMFQF